MGWGPRKFNVAVGSEEEKKFRSACDPLDVLEKRGRKFKEREVNSQ